MAAQPELVGVEGRNIVFNVNGVGIAVDPATMQTRHHSLSNVNGGAVELPDGVESMTALMELAAAAAELDDDAITIVAAGSKQRTFAVPRAVRNEVERALDWCFDNDHCSTAVGMGVAETLLAGGHVDIETVKHVNQYFTARAIDRKSEGWRPDGSEFPSPERVSWSLWGGDAAQRWASKIVDTNSAIIADASVGIDMFTSITNEALEEGDRELWGQFDGPSMEHVIALFARRPSDGGWLVWSNGSWCECDDPADDPSLLYNPVCELDDDSGMYVAAALYDAPEMPVALSDIDPVEWSMMQELALSIDDVMIDSVMTAAGSADPSIDHDDGVYTSEERSKNAKRQARDANGMFIKQGDTAKTRLGTPLTVVGTRPSDGKVIVRGASGTMYAVNGKQLNLDRAKAKVKAKSAASKRKTLAERYPEIAAYNKAADARREADRKKEKKKRDRARMAKAAVDARRQANQERLDAYNRITHGNRNPRVTGARVPAHLSKVLTRELHGMLDTYEERARHAAEVRKAPKKSAKIARKARREEKKIIQAEDRRKAREKAWRDARYKHKKYPSQTKKKKKKDTSVYGEALVASADSLPGGATEELEPLYFAIVGKDDPQAVMELVAIAPEEPGSEKTTSFKRQGEEWVRDDKIVQDLKSPTPPPVVVLEDELLADVIGQVDAGGAQSEEAPAEEAPAGDEKTPEPVAASGTPDKSSTVLVALPAEGEPVWSASSEKVPHLTMLFFGDEVPPELLDEMRAAVSAVANELKPVMVSVTGREALGDDQADVAMVDPDILDDAREGLLANPAVRTAYESTKQYPKWTPHVTLGYPETPATDEPPGSIEFDRFALWNGDYEGDEYLFNQSSEQPIDDMPDEAILASIPDLMLTPVWGSNNEILALVSGGGIDRNRGGAEHLRRYWTIGKGGAKIRWNTGGDWRRCVRHLSKYLGPRAKGYCALRHKEMTGMWTGDKAHRAMYSSGDEIRFSTDDIVPEIDVITAAGLRARADDAHNRMSRRASKELVEGIVGPIQQSETDGVDTEQQQLPLQAVPTESANGASFFIPLVIPEDTESGDGRKFKKDSLTVRDMPIPLLWQITTGEGHNGSVLVGQVHSVERVAEGLGNAHGVFDSGSYGQEAQRLVGNKMLRWISADLDQFSANELDNAADEKDKGKIESAKMEISAARLMGITLVPKPAFQQCTIELVDDFNEEEPVSDGTYTDVDESGQQFSIVASGGNVFNVPVHPPKDWFNNPDLDKPTALTITDDGHVFGHIASWDVDHIGMQFGTRPPRNNSGYQYFHTGALRTADGVDVSVGQLTLSGGHAPMHADAMAAAKHYDDTQSAIADVHAGEDAFGIWVSGALRPGVSPEQIRAFRASAPSGDWRSIRGQLELVAVCQVNVPGFPVARAQVASGAVVSLVAAGVLHEPVSVSQVNGELLVLKRKRALAELRVASLRAQKKIKDANALTAAATAAEERLMNVDEYVESFKTIPPAKREKLAKAGKALPDGSYPIENVADLKRALSAYGRAKNKSAARRHIAKRARALGKADMIPDRWVLATAIAYNTAFSDIPPEERPITDIPDLKAAVHAYSQVELSSRPATRRHIVRQARALGRTDLVPSTWNELSVDDFGLSYLDTRAVLISSLSPDNATAIRSSRRPRSPKSTASADDSEHSLAIGDGGGSWSTLRKKYTPETQPRDAHGKFRQVLARLKVDLGSARAMQDVVEKVEEAENLDDAGDYAEAAKSAVDVIEIVDRIDEGGINPENVVGVREGARALGSAIANLPLAFGEQGEKVRYSDMPPAIQTMIVDMIDRVNEKIGAEDGRAATEMLRKFMSGGITFSQMDISRELSKMLRLLT